ncbi:MAG: hypothetical protein M1339_00185, partial [Bacteroidetes bacterium]|nr:hypothetical protein [Bacteroidota bacterium]
MNFQIHFDITFYLFLLSGAIAAGLSYLMYRKLDGISRTRQVVLGILRAISIFLLFMAILNVVTDFVRFDFKKREVYVLLDDSKSMSLTDGTVPRPEVVRNILKSASFENLGKYFSVKPVVFGGSVLRKENVDSLRYDQPATDLEAAVAHVSAAGKKGETAFVILLSDGEYNAGGNPIETVRALPFPVYTIGIGDSTAPRDVVVKQVIPAPSIYAGKRSVVKAIIASNGFGGANVTAYLYEDGKQVGSKGVTLPQYGNVEVSFNYIPGTPGIHVLSVYVPPLSGEFSKRNNSSSATADVRKGKYSILLVAGEPAMDAAFIRRNIESSGNFDLKVLVQKNGSIFYEKDAAAVLSGKYDGVVLCDFPNAQSTATLRDVAALLNSNHLPYAYFTGPDFSMSSVAELPRFPVSIAGFEPEEFQVGISPVGSETLPTSLQVVSSLIQT